MATHNPHHSAARLALAAALGAAGLLGITAAAGCQHGSATDRAEIHGDVFPADGEPRAVDRFVQVQSAAAARTDATHGLRVLVNGALEWARTVPTQVEGTDSLDLRLRRSVPVGRPLRVTASCELLGAQRVSLTISADED